MGAWVISLVFLSFSRSLGLKRIENLPLLFSMLTVLFLKRISSFGISVVSFLGISDFQRRSRIASDNLGIFGCFLR